MLFIIIFNNCLLEKVLTGEQTWLLTKTRSRGGGGGGGGGGGLWPFVQAHSDDTVG